MRLNSRRSSSCCNTKRNRQMGFNIKNNYGPNIDNHDGGVIRLQMGRNGRWAVDAEEAEIVEEVKEDEKNDDNVLPLSPLDTIFHRALNVARVKEAIRQIIITKGEAGRCRLSLKQWFVVHKVLEEISWLDDDTDTRFIEWIRQVFQYEGRTGDFKSVKSEFKHSHSLTWGADTVKDRQTGREYRALADYVRSLFVTIGDDGSIHDREEFLNLGSDGKPRYIGRGLRKK